MYQWFDLGQGSFQHSYKGKHHGSKVGLTLSHVSSSQKFAGLTDCVRHGWWTLGCNPVHIHVQVSFAEYSGACYWINMCMSGKPPRELWGAATLNWVGAEASKGTQSQFAVWIILKDDIMLHCAGHRGRHWESITKPRTPSCNKSLIEAERFLWTMGREKGGKAVWESQQFWQNKWERHPVQIWKDGKGTSQSYTQIYHTIKPTIYFGHISSLIA